VKVGVNLQPGQLLLIRSQVQSYPFVRLLTKAAYAAGAASVVVAWTDEEVAKETILHQDLAFFTAHQYQKDQYQDILSHDSCVISVISNTPGLLKDCPVERLGINMKAQNEVLQDFREALGRRHIAWTIVGDPARGWAKTVFADYPAKKAEQLLRDLILDVTRVSKDGDAIQAWQEHNQRLEQRNAQLNALNLEKLHFTNSLGTDLEVGLVEQHIWSGGGEYTLNGVFFNPNLPTEENFTMPHKNKVNGTVYASMPLNYLGKLIKNFSLTFQDGLVVDYHAQENEDVLKQLLETDADNGSKRLGEVALVPVDSPISQHHILFYETLYDENASCHLALGRSYPMNIQGGNDQSFADLALRGANYATIHVDFMFGTPDLKVVGISHDGQETTIFIDGKFVI
jgi:aminopeptidase